MPDTSKATKRGFSDAEKAAMKERASELKAEQRRGARKADGEADVQAKLAEMSESDRVIAERLHALVKENAPELTPRTWYGMPAYANAEGKVVCFFTPASKFNERYASFGFQPAARLDEGSMWPTTFALTKLTEADEKKLADLLRKAVG